MKNKYIVTCCALWMSLFLGLLQAGEPLQEEVVEEQCQKHNGESQKEPKSLPEKIEIKAKRSFGDRKTIYYVEHEGAYHYPDLFFDYEYVVQLQDGSRWKLDSWNWYKTDFWSSYDPIIVVQNQGCLSSYDYYLVNLAKDTKVKANIIAPPYVHAAYWIYSIDDYVGEIFLQDGSLWRLPNCSTCRNILYHWLDGDVVEIGVNAASNRSYYPHILINSRTGEYVEAVCLY